MRELPTLREMVSDGRVHVLDGAMGTLLYDRGIFVNVCFDELNVSEPSRIEQVHREYVEAGAEILETNTFGANPVKLSAHGLEDRTEELNRAGAEVARRAAGADAGGGPAGGERARILGAIGPLGIRLEPFGPTSVEEAEDLFRRQVAGLVEGGVDGFILETFSDLTEVRAALSAVRSLSDLPIVAQVSVTEEGATSYGHSAEEAARALEAAGADVVGLNCSVGPAVMLDAVERMAAVTDLPLSAQPNAGLPRTVRDRKIYLASPEYMARYARRMIQAGVRFVGGCCGTTPQHVARIRDQVKSLQPRIDVAPLPETREGGAEVEARGAAGEGGFAARPGPPVPMAERSRLGRLLSGGRWATVVEITPPTGWDVRPIEAIGRRLAEEVVDAVAVADVPRGGSRMGGHSAALHLLRESGVEPLLHYTCRDRNMMGMVRDLLGAAASGVRNLLLVSGDPPVTGPYPDSTAVFDIDSIGLTNLVRRLNHGLDPGGHPIGAPTPFVAGVAANQGAVDVEREVERFWWKVDAGAEFAVTQPVFDPEELERFLERVSDFRIPVLAGIWPLASLRQAEYLANEVPGVRIPSDVLERIRRAQERGEEAARAEGVSVAREMLDAVRPLVQGVQVVAPGNEVERALAVLE